MMRIKKITIIVALLSLSILITNWVTVLFIGNIDYPQTFATEYNRTQTGSNIVVTKWAELRTNSTFFHIATKPTCPGYVGMLVTSAGMFDYEYGMFAPDYLDSAFEYSIEDLIFTHEPEFSTRLDTINGTVVRLIESNNNFGVYIPLQENMLWGLTFYPSELGKTIKKDLINMATTIKYHELKSTVVIQNL